MKKEAISVIKSVDTYWIPSILKQNYIIETPAEKRSYCKIRKETFL